MGAGGDFSLQTAEQVLQMHTVSDNPLAIAQVRVHTLQIIDGVADATALERPFDAELDLLQIDAMAFEQVVVGALLQCLDGPGRVIGIREDEHRCRLIAGSRGVKDLKAILFREVEVDENDLEEALLDVL